MYLCHLGIGKTQNMAAESGNGKSKLDFKIPKER